MRYIILITVMIFSFGCSQKGFDRGSLKVEDKRDSIFYGLTEAGKAESLREKYGAEWRNHY